MPCFSVSFIVTQRSLDITGYVNRTLPTGWIRAGTRYLDNLGLADTNSALFTTPYGEQVAFARAGSGIGKTLSETLTTNTIYTLTVNVGKRNTQTADSPCIIQLRVDGVVVLAETSGTATNSNMSESVTLTYTTGIAHPQVGKALRIDLLGPGDHVLFDNVQLATNAAPVDDITKPTPDPLTWVVDPYAVDDVTISMTATTAVDNVTVQYLFTNTVKGTSSGWVFDTEWTETGLEPASNYTYQVKARDVSANLNETGWSLEKNATTLAAIPGVIFRESFEAPSVFGDADGKSDTDPDGWDAVDPRGNRQVGVTGSDLSLVFND